MDNISTYDFINNKYTMDDYIECFIITMGILLIVYMFVISRSEPTMVLVITFALVFAFLVMVQKKYKDKYNSKLQDVRGKLNLIKRKLNVHQPTDDTLEEEEEPIHHPHHKYKPTNINKNPSCVNCKDPKQNGIFAQIATDECQCNTKEKCADCNNCKWCGGKCIPKDSVCGHVPDSIDPKKKSKCSVGKTNISELSTYRANDCNLFKNYNKCIKCASDKQCGYLQADGSVKCMDCSDTNDAYYQPDGSIKKTTNCLNSPDDGGFGCPGPTYQDDNTEPINPFDPINTTNKVCKYPPN